MTLILVHGRAQQGQDPAKLRQQWMNALTEGMRKAGVALPHGIEVRFPFYGDRLDELVKEIDAPLVSDVAERGAAQDSAEAEFRGELLYEIAQGAGVSDEDIQRHYGGAPQEKGPLNWAWVQAILKALEGTPIGDFALDAFTRDAYVYLTNWTARRTIDEIVAASLPEGPCVVVGHSLGSVVAYNVMRSASPRSGNAKHTYVTVGSPLGLKAIKRRLDSPIAMPGCVRSWFNAMDERDVVALHPLDSDHFNVTPAIDNKTDVDNHTNNRHGIVGYLDDPIVARRIRDALAV